MHNPPVDRIGCPMMSDTLRPSQTGKTSAIVWASEDVRAIDLVLDGARGVRLIVTVNLVTNGNQSLPGGGEEVSGV